MDLDRLDVEKFRKEAAELESLARTTSDSTHRDAFLRLAQALTQMADLLEAEKRLIGLF